MRIFVRFYATIPVGAISESRRSGIGVPAYHKPNTVAATSYCRVTPKLNETNNFTPWLAENIEILSDALGLELEVTSREAPVGELSLDLLVRDLGSSRTGIIENQYGETDRRHFGQLLTYASGLDASIVIDGATGGN